MMPFYQLGDFGYATAMALATLLGVGFGTALERAGFSRSTVLAAQFYGRDMRVFKVMFSAIVTAAIGLGFFSSFGLLNLAALKIPETFLGPHIVGGFMLGAGFIIAGYCPGTSVVATASGHLDGLITLVGVGLGSLVFAFFWPQLEPFYGSGAMGVRTLPQLFGMPWAVVALLVLVMAVVCFVFAEKLEAFLLARDKLLAPKPFALPLRRVSLGLGAVSIVALLGLAVPAPAASGADRSPSQATPQRWTLLTLANHLMQGPESLWIVDLRPRDACLKARIPGALCAPEHGKLTALVAGLPASRALLFYDEGSLRAPPPAAQSFEGKVALLEGGFEGYQALAAVSPPPPEDTSHASLSRYRRLVALHAWQSGAQELRAPLKIIPHKVKRRVIKGGGC